MRTDKQRNALPIARGGVVLVVVDAIIIGAVFYLIASGIVNNLAYGVPMTATTTTSTTTTSTAVASTVSSSSASTASTAASSSSTASTSTAANTIGVANSKALGSYLVTGKGFTLYYFVPDSVGNATSPPVSHCTTALSCIGVWPVFYAPKIVVPSSLNASDFTTFTRADGTNQTAYLGHPLYLYIGDTSPGQVNGNAININGGYWYVVPVSPTATFKS